MPDVSVVLCVYNAERYVDQAIASILAQTDCHFELIVVDDASTDRSRDVAEAALRQDPRVRRLNLPRNVGLATARNAGIAMAESPLVAHMDADDIALPGRLASQHRYMVEHPEIDCLGTAGYSVDANRRRIVEAPSRPPTHADVISWLLLFGNVMVNPTMMMRTPVLRAHPFSQDPFFRYCEDYELWCRLSPRHSFANLTTPLLDYRVHAGQVTSQNRDVQESSAVVCAQRYAENLLGQPVAAADFYCLHDLARDLPPLGLADFERITDLMTRLMAAVLSQRPAVAIDACAIILNDFLARVRTLAARVAGDDVSASLHRQLAHASALMRQTLLTRG